MAVDVPKGERWDPRLDMLAPDVTFAIRRGQGWTEARCICNECNESSYPSVFGEDLVWWCPNCGRLLARKGSVNL